MIPAGRLSPIYVTYGEFKEVLGVTWTRAHVRRMIKQGRFPKPYEISQKRIGWRYDELMQWVERHQRRRRRRVLLEDGESLKKPKLTIV